MYPPASKRATFKLHRYSNATPKHRISGSFSRNGPVRMERKKPIIPRIETAQIKLWLVLAARDRYKVGEAWTLWNELLLERKAK